MGQPSGKGTDPGSSRAGFFKPITENQPNRPNSVGKPNRASLVVNRPLEPFSVLVVVFVVHKCGFYRPTVFKKNNKFIYFTSLNV